MYVAVRLCCRRQRHKAIRYQAIFCFGLCALRAIVISGKKCMSHSTHYSTNSVGCSNPETLSSMWMSAPSSCIRKVTVLFEGLLECSMAIIIVWKCCFQRLGEKYWKLWNVCVTQGLETACVHRSRSEGTLFVTLTSKLCR